MLYYPLVFITSKTRKYTDDVYWKSWSVSNEIEKLVENIYLIKVLQKDTEEIENFNVLQKTLNKIDLNKTIFNSLSGFLPTFLTMFVLSILVGIPRIAKTLTLDFIGVTLRLFQALGSVSNSFNSLLNSQIHINYFINFVNSENSSNQDSFVKKSNLEEQGIYCDFDECDIQSVPREGINQRVIDRYTSRVIAAGGKPREQFAGPILLPNEKDSIRNYFSQVSLIDKGIGHIINELETLRLRDNTLILYTSDHGFSLGNHGIWGHGLAAWPSSIKKPSFNIPLIFSGPNISNEHSNALVSQLDIGNTILNYVGLDPIKASYNDSQIIELKKNNSSFRKAIFMEQEETRAIRTEDWLYMERINNQEMPFLNPELYDLRNDPLEYKNLSEEIKYKSIIETLSKKLHDYFKSHSNPKFDLWNGGKAKSNVSSEAFWKQIWGEDWSCTY